MMNLTKQIPYEKRLYEINQTNTAIVWPFLDQERGSDNYELFLDVNALKNAEWFEQLPNDIKSKCTINPLPAIKELWHSNPEFKKDAINKINKMVSYFKGQKFKNNYAQELVNLIVNNEKVFRSDFSVVMPFIAIMKSIVLNNNAHEVLQKLKTMMQNDDLPHFTALITLTALTALLKDNQSFKLNGDNKTAFSYLESFLGNNQSLIDVDYLRNRAGDINLWFTIPRLLQSSYNHTGTMAIVTGDKVLYRLIFRLIPHVYCPNITMTHTLSPEMPGDMAEQILTIFNKPPRPGPTNDKKLQLMKNLFEFAKECCKHQDERDALENVYKQWWEPGWNKQFVFK